MPKSITISDLTAGQLLELARREANRCYVTANYYQAIPRKNHLWYKWFIKAEGWETIIAEIEMAAITAKGEE